jgi:cobaltochelatase CobN
VIVYLTTADTDLLTLADAIPRLPPGLPPVRAENPSDWDGRTPPGLLDGARLVALRLLGGKKALPDFDGLVAECRRRGVPLVALPGDQEPDPDLAAASTVPPEEALQALRYVLHGGPENFAQLLRFWADRHAGCAFGCREPRPLPWSGVYVPGAAAPLTPEEWLERHPDDGRPAVGVLFYRAHWLSRNLGFVDDLAAALEAEGCRPLAAFCYSLKPPEALEALAGRIDALIATLSFAGAAEAFEALDVPVLQAVASLGPSGRWRGSLQGLGPLDVAMNVALPELDGRIITVPLCFKEEERRDPVLGVPVRRYVSIPDRVAQVAALAARWARLRRTPNARKRVAFVLTNYPSKNARIGNAVGLDTPASLVRVLRAMRAAGYAIPDAPEAEDGDRLVRALIDRCSNDREFMSDEQLAGAEGHLPAADYARAFGRLPADARERLRDAWGDPPGEVFRWGESLVVPGLRLGNAFVGVQPPRGFGENPVAVYHSPDLVPTHHYLGYYRWLRDVFRADAVVHVGKHGTLEWLPGKGIGLSAGCFPEAVLQDLPNFYPYIVNNPGEGTQAKRRSHACVVDHLIPAMTSADTYDDLARLEQLLDQYASAQALDPAKAPYLQAEIWEVVRRARLDRDLQVLPQRSDLEPGADAPPEAAAFDAFLQEVDGYLCELKAAQIRDGLHVLGEVPEDPARLADLLYHLVRLPNGDVPSRTAAGSSCAAGWSAARPRTRPSGWRRCSASPSATSCRVCAAPPTRSPTSSGAWRGASCRRGPAGRRRAAWRRSCRQGATSTPSTRGPSPRARRGRWAGGWATRCWSATAARRAAGRRRWASSSGAPPPCAPRGTTWRRCCGSWGCGRAGRRRAGAWPGWR